MPADALYRLNELAFRTQWEKEGHHLADLAQKDSRYHRGLCPTIGSLAV